MRMSCDSSFCTFSFDLFDFSFCLLLYLMYFVLFSERDADMIMVEGTSQLCNDLLVGTYFLLPTDLGFPIVIMNIYDSTAIPTCIAQVLSLP